MSIMQYAATLEKGGRSNKNFRAQSFRAKSINRSVLYSFLLLACISTQDRKNVEDRGSQCSFIRAKYIQTEFYVNKFVSANDKVLSKKPHRCFF